MAKFYLGLGSNEGNRRENLEKALHELSLLAVPGSLRFSSVYATPALLPSLAPVQWNRPFWNLAAELLFEGSPLELLEQTQKIENHLGRVRAARWSPRTLDVDLLCSEGASPHLQSDFLKLPHPEILNRAFVLDPLAELAPRLKLPGDSQTILDRARQHQQHAPRLMGIVNMTPDSFSDGDRDRTAERVLKQVQEWDSIPVAMVDIGGESTRPGAVWISDAEEWERVGPVLKSLIEAYRGKKIRPLWSVDTRKASVAERALEAGADLINDVSGFTDPAMLEVVRSSRCGVMAMHSLKIPADPTVCLSNEEEAHVQILRWMEETRERLEKAGISQDRLILDPGIGFGKTSLQSVEIMRSLGSYQKLGCPIVMGHSRKSFQKDFSSAVASERDPETLGLSLGLVQKGVDILRVHDPVLHHRAILARGHVF